MRQPGDLRGRRPVQHAAIGVLIAAVLVALLLGVLLWPSVIKPELTAPDKSAYIAKNERVLGAIPVFGGGKLVNSYSIGIPGGFDENGPPYKAYVTWRWYGLRTGISCRDTEGFYGIWLKRTGWEVTGWDGTDRAAAAEVFYRRGKSALDVLCLAGRAGQPNQLGLHVDYDDYPRGSH